jgi:hypothetical protein
MQLKYRIEDGLVVLFSVVIAGYSSKQVLQDLLDKVWLANRWHTRFYCGITERCRKFVIEVHALNKKDELSKSEFVRQFKMRCPTTKNIIIS